LKWREILGVAGGDARVAPQRHGGNLAIGQTPRTASREIEQFGRLARIGTRERFRRGQGSRANASSCGDNGPQRNSLQAIVLMPRTSAAVSQASTLVSAVEPGTNASMRKFVSK
jgi:hypothetical protein